MTLAGGNPASYAAARPVASILLVEDEASTLKRYLRLGLCPRSTTFWLTVLVFVPAR
jgi:hypothetical protein